MKWDAQLVQLALERLCRAFLFLKRRVEMAKMYLDASVGVCRLDMFFAVLRQGWSWSWQPIGATSFHCAI